jgi:hypothetical protein
MAAEFPEGAKFSGFFGSHRMILGVGWKPFPTQRVHTQGRSMAAPPVCVPVSSLTAALEIADDRKYICRRLAALLLSR